MNLPASQVWWGTDIGVKIMKIMTQKHTRGDRVRSEVEETHFVILFKVQRFVLSVGSSCKLVSLSLYSCPRLSSSLIGPDRSRDQ